MSAKLISIGYQGRTINDLIDLLLKEEVEQLIDIRENPYSRRKEFSKNALSKQLEDAGIKYIHIKQAGNPYRMEANLGLEQCLNRYYAYLQENKDILSEVDAALRERTSAFLCYEREHQMCHRSVLIRALEENGGELNIVKIE